MKHKLLFRRFFVSLLLLAVSTLSWAYSFVVDGIYYDKNSDGTSVTVTYQLPYRSNWYPGYVGNIIIPESVTYDGVTYNVTRIGTGSFSGCTQLISVTIPSSVTNIDTSFEQCSNLVKAEFSSIESLCNISFKYMISNPLYYTKRLYIRGEEVTDVVIPNSVTSIGSYAFYGCSGLTSVTIPNSVTSIGESAFNGCSGLTSITIPNSVTSIDQSAFSGCSGLTKAEFASIESLCNISFAESASNPLYYAHHLYINGQEMMDVVIPESVTSIGKFAFYDCSGLASVTIGNSVTSIGESAFNGCSGLTSVTIGNSVTSIGYDAFRGCSGLTSVIINSNAVLSKNYSWSNNLENVFGEQVKEYVIGDNVTSVGESAFSGCSGITSINIPNSVTRIGNDAFSGCSGLTSINIPESVTSIGEVAFSGCSGLTSITIPESVTSIGQSAFSGCSGLTTISIPNSVMSIGDGAFSGCTSLPVVDNIRYADTYLLEALDKEQNSYVIKEGTKYIGSAAFKDCSNLRSIVIPNSVTSISGAAFSGCIRLLSVTMGNGVTSIGDYAFGNCKWLTSITIPESVTIIGDGAFDNCSGLTSMTIPESVTKILPYTFDNCSGLTSINIPNGVTSIGGSAFSGCSGLTSITIPNSVTSIGEVAFSGCTKLTTATIGNGVTRIGANVFEGCSGLTSVNLNTFFPINNTFGPQVQECFIGEAVTNIGGGAFSNCPSLVSVSVDANNPKYDSRNKCNAIIETASNILIAGCQKTVIPEGVTGIGEGAFYHSSVPTDVDIPNGVEKIGKSAFNGCSDLLSVKIPESVKLIEDSAFYNCSNLRSIECLVTVNNISAPVKPEPGIDPSSITEYFFPFNPAHPDDPTTANVDEVTDVTVDNIYPEDECKTLWKNYYLKVYNNRTATSKTNTKWTNLSRNPYFKRNGSAVLISTYAKEMEEYEKDLYDYETLYNLFINKGYTVIPVPVTGDAVFGNVPYANTNLYVNKDYVDAYKLVAPWKYFWNILPYDPTAVEEVKSGEINVPDENAPIYDLMGRRLSKKPTSGYYIQGGKKFFVK